MSNEHIVRILFWPSQRDVKHLYQSLITKHNFSIQVILLCNHVCNGNETVNDLPENCIFLFFTISASSLYKFCYNCHRKDETNFNIWSIIQWQSSKRTINFSKTSRQFKLTKIGIEKYNKKYQPHISEIKLTLRIKQNI